MGLDLRDKAVRGAGLTGGVTEKRNLMELSVQEKATPEHLLMTGGEAGTVLMLGLVKVVGVYLEVLVRVDLDRLRDKEMLMDGELQALVDGEGLVLALLRDRAGEVGTGRITTRDLSLERGRLPQWADLGLTAGGGMEKKDAGD